MIPRSLSPVLALSLCNLSLLVPCIPSDSSPSTPLPTDPTACPPPPTALPWPVAVDGGNGGREAGKYCCLCGAWFNNPLMAQQHYEGKKHRRNAARARLLEQLAGSLDATESTGQPSWPPSLIPVMSEGLGGWGVGVLRLGTKKDDKWKITFTHFKCLCAFRCRVHFTDITLSKASQVIH